MLDKLTGCPSEHRTFIIDVDTAGLWQAPLQPPPTSKQRGFTTKNKPRTTAFINELQDLLTKANFNQVLEASKTAISSNKSESTILANLERADNIMTSCMLQAERSIMPSKRACSHPWSPALVMAQRKKGLVSNLLSAMLANKTIHRRVINRFHRNAMTIDPTWDLPPLTIANVQRLAHDTSQDATKHLHQAIQL